MTSQTYDKTKWYMLCLLNQDQYNDTNTSDDTSLSAAEQKYNNFLR